MERKRAHDPLYSPRSAARATATGFLVGEHGEVFAGPVIVGAGLAGISVVACLTVHGVPYVLLERYDCVASLWRHRTYRRLLYLPKCFCELPLLPFPASYIPQVPHQGAVPRLPSGVPQARTSAWHPRTAARRKRRATMERPGIDLRADDGSQMKFASSSRAS